MLQGQASRAMQPANRDRQKRSLSSVLSMMLSKAGTAAGPGKGIPGTRRSILKGIDSDRLRPIVEMRGPSA